MLTELRTFFASIPKAKTAKLVRAVIDSIAKVPNTTELQARPLFWFLDRFRRAGRWAGAVRRADGIVLQGV